MKDNNERNLSIALVLSFVLVLIAYHYGYNTGRANKTPSYYDCLSLKESGLVTVCLNAYGYEKLW